LGDRQTSGPPDKARWRDVVKDVILESLRAEGMTVPGIANIAGMVLLLVLALAFVLPPVFEVGYRLLRDLVQAAFGIDTVDFDSGPPPVQVLLVFGFFMLLCVGVLGYLNGPNRRRR